MAHSQTFQRIEPFSRQCDFDIWLKKFELFLKIGKVDADSKIDILLTNLDISIFETVVTTFPKTCEYDKVVNFLKERYSTQDKYLNRLEFFNVTYSGSYDEYAGKLQTLFKNFSGNALREEILIAKFLTTVPKALSAELRVRRPETLSECVRICNSLGSSLQASLSTAAVTHASKPRFQAQKPNVLNSNVSNAKKCFRCGSSTHLASDVKCPAKNASCNFCRKVGHFASVCTTKQRSEHSSNKESNKAQHGRNINVVSFKSDYSAPTVAKSHIDATLFTNSGCHFNQSFLVDSGSDVCTLPLAVYERFFTAPLRPFNNASLKNFDKSEIKVFGILPNVQCEFSGRSAMLDFFICDEAVFGANAISLLHLTVTGHPTQLVTYSIDRSPKGEDVCVGPTNSKPGNCADTKLPKLKGFTFFIKLKPDAPASLVQKPRRVPFALEAEIEREISKLLQNDIIEEVDSSPYLSPIVCVPKGDGIRLCVDYKKINQHIVVDQHPLPTADEIFAHLAGAKFFSKLDLKSAYHQLEIREDSRDLTAFTSHVGQFRYKRLPFGLANAPSAYMKVISCILRDCENTACYLDDILIYGDTQESHDACLDKTLRRLRDYGMTLNDSKCQFRRTTIQFLGRLLSADGISPLPTTLEAILNAPVPHDKPSLRSFMGLVNFYRNFIPNAARISSTLYDLLKDHAVFTWTEGHEMEFQLLKQCLADHVPLAFYDSDVNTQTFLTTDASGHGISAVLSQVCKRTNEEKPVYFLSRKLSENERSYSVSEKEFLAVLWATERLHQYLYGRPFTVRTDHQALRQLLMNGFAGGSAPCRVIRWAAKLLQYNFSVSYIPGKENRVADALSRVPQTSSDSSVELFAVSLHNADPGVPVTLQEIKTETSADDELQTLLSLIENGWPSRVGELPSSMRKFWNVRREFSTIDGVILRNDKYVIPVALQERLVTFAHEGHMGISKCKSRLRQYYWWANLNETVESKIRACPCCREPYREAPVQVPEYSPKLWHQIAIDVKGPVYDSSHRPYYILVVIDCFSKFVFTQACDSTVTRRITNFLDKIFSIFGHCTILTSDNGPQFISHHFAEYLRKRGIIHKRASLFNPQSNGVVERVNRNLQKLLEVDNFHSLTDLQEMLNTYTMNYNATAHSTTGKAPGDLMFSFRMKTNLNMVNESPDNLEVGVKVRERSEANAAYANSRRRPDHHRRFSVGDHILTCRNQKRTITSVVGPYSYKLDNGLTINARRIRRKLSGREVERSPTLGMPSPISDSFSSFTPVSETSVCFPNNVSTDTTSTVPEVAPRTGRVRRRPAYLQDYDTG